MDPGASVFYLVVILILPLPTCGALKVILVLLHLQKQGFHYIWTQYFAEVPNHLYNMPVKKSIIRWSLEAFRVFKKQMVHLLTVYIFPLKV